MSGELEFRRLFEESPDVLLVLLPDAPRFTMVAATRGRLEATMVTREQTIGHGLFDVFPDNPSVVDCYPNLLNQAIMNLVSNAINAIDGPGSIDRIGTEYQLLHRSKARRHN